MLAVSGDKRRLPFCRRRKFAADDQQSVFIAANKPLNQDARTLVNRNRVGGFDFWLCVEVDKYPAAVIPINGFDYDRQAKLLCGLPRVLRIGDGSSLRNRDPASLKN